MSCSCTEHVQLSNILHELREMEETSETWCKSCKTEYGYPSRLQRHLQTQKHVNKQSLDDMVAIAIANRGCIEVYTCIFLFLIAMFTKN